jgi:flagellar hook-associated protein 1 FlgK
LQDLTTRPGDLAARESLLTAARSVSGRINGVATVVERVRDSVNNALQGATDSVNAISSQLADLNVQITDAMNRSGSGSTPNDLLDKRDMLMQELSTYVSNTVIENGDGTFNVYLRSGQPLVSKTQFSELTVLRDPYDPQNVQVGLILGAQGNNPKTVRYDEAALGQGKIAGMLGVRDTDLPQYRNIIGVIASQFAQRMNTLQREGFDLNGAPGENMFSFESGRASRSLLNESTAVAALTTVDFSKVTANDYEVFNDAGTIKYRVANTRDAFVAADVVSSGTPPVYKIGSQFEFSISGTSVTGDKFLLQPTATAASSLRVDLTGPSSIAAGRVQNAKGDNSNLQKMALLQTTPVEFSAFGASQDATLTSAFNQLVSKVGNRTREVQEALATRIAVREGAEAQQQDVSGVNLDEEAANLLKYQQAYQAAGQVIAMSKSLFDSLLNALG